MENSKNKVECSVNQDAVKRIYIPIKDNKKEKSYPLSPQASEFCLIPKYNPALRDYVEFINWDILNKTLHVRIAETSLFETYEWVLGINERTKEINKSPFCDLEKDALGLCMFDKDGRCVSRIKFTGLEITEHNCHMDVNIQLEPLIYNITLKYEKSQKLENVESNSNEENAEIDDEWM